GRAVPVGDRAVRGGRDAGEPERERVPGGDRAARPEGAVHGLRQRAAGGRVGVRVAARRRAVRPARRQGEPGAALPARPHGAGGGAARGTTRCAATWSPWRRVTSFAIVVRLR